MSASDFTPPADEYSCAITLESFCFITDSICATTSGRVSPICATRMATSACSSGVSSESTWAASAVCRLATTSAIVCGDSLRRKTWICSGGVRRRNSNGRRSIVAARREMISSARSRAERLLQQRRA